MSGTIHRAIHSFTATTPNHLTIEQGDLLVQLENSQDVWTQVKILKIDGDFGWVPTSYIAKEQTTGLYRANRNMYQGHGANKRNTVVKGELVRVTKATWNQDGSPGTHWFTNIENSYSSRVKGEFLDREADKEKPRTGPPAVPAAKKATKQRNNSAVSVDSRPIWPLAPPPAYTQTTTLQSKSPKSFLSSVLSILRLRRVSKSKLNEKEGDAKAEKLEMF